MKVLIVCLSYSWGGLEQIAMLDAIASAKVFSVSFLLFEQSVLHQRLYALMQEQKVTVQIMSLKNAFSKFFDFRIKGILQLWGQEKDAVVHLHQPQLLASFVPWLDPEVNLIVSRHIWNDHQKKNLFYQWLYGRVNYLIVMSQALRDQILKTHAIDPKKLQVIACGLDFKKFCPSESLRSQQRQQWKVPLDATCVGIVARLDPKKGQDIFIRVACRLIERLRIPPSQLQFFIIGEPTANPPPEAIQYTQGLYDFVRTHQLEPYLRFTGFMPNIPAFMSALDILVLPSVTEAFGLVAIEAMAMSCSVVLPAAGSAFEITQSGRFGSLCKDLTVSSVLEAVQPLIEKPLERRQVQQEAMAFVRSFYGYEQRIEKTHRLYCP